MGTTIFLALLFAVQVGPEPQEKTESAPPAETTSAPPEKPATTATETTTGEDSKKEKSIEVERLTPEQQTKLLSHRFDGGMGNSFAQFANMFFVKSRIDSGIGIGLMTKSKDVADAELVSPFPESYEPTLAEFLDAIALQTKSEWKYDPNGVVKGTVEEKGPIKELAFFEFKEAKRAKPYEVKLADGWKTVDHGNWVMHVPPSFPVGMDIYEMGTYSPPEKTDKATFLKTIRSEVALQWANRVKADAKADDLKPAKVGEYDALYFEAMVPTQLGEDMKWRQWVFMVENDCYFVVSTILPALDAKIFPDVEKMLKSFRSKAKPAK